MKLIRIAVCLMVVEKPFRLFEYTNHFVVDMDKVEVKETPLYYQFGKGIRIRKRDVGVATPTSNGSSSISFEMYIFDGENCDHAKELLVHMVELEVMARFRQVEALKMALMNAPTIRTQRLFLEEEGVC